MATERTQVAIVGAGPAGLLLGRLLSRSGIETVILEARDRDYVEARIRAGILEQGTVDVLDAAGVGTRLHAEGLRHGGIALAFDGERHRIAIEELTGGRTVTAYGQTEVVRDLIAARLDDGLPLRFEAPVRTLRGLGAGADAPSGPATVSYGVEGDVRELRADLVVGCDGFNGVCRQAVADRLTVCERAYPFAWLGILADAAPAIDELVYARHPRGFALYSMRSPQVSRLYLQVPVEERVQAWTAERIWSELHARLDVPGHPPVAEGEITDVGITPMRGWVAGPLSHGRLHLAGDAAHIVPPTGAKGLNLAVADVALLAPAIAEALRDGEPEGLRRYSERALARVWRAQRFSWWMTTTLHEDPHGDAYGAQLALAELRSLVTSRAQSTALAESYAGSPPPSEALAPLPAPQLAHG